VFGLALIFGAGGLLAALAAVVTAMESVHRPPPASDQVTIAGLHFTHPTLNVAEAVLLTLAAFGATVLAIAVRAIWRQRQAYRSFSDGIGVLGSLQHHPTVRVISDPRPQAFCAGYLRPAVYVSQRTVDLLADDQLEAVLAHEHHHLRVRDPLRFACARILGKALFFVPVLRALGERYSDVAELGADEAAVRASAGDQAPLASALLVFEANSNPDVAGISPERVDSLLGAPARWRLPGRLMTASLGSLSGLSALIWQASSVASAHASFNLPILSSQPCLAVLTMLPLLGCLGILVLRRAQHREAKTLR
jgi:hypothetical protein